MNSPVISYKIHSPPPPPPLPRSHVSTEATATAENQFQLIVKFPYIQVDKLEMRICTWRLFTELHFIHLLYI